MNNATEIVLAPPKKRSIGNGYNPYQ